MNDTNAYYTNGVTTFSTSEGLVVVTAPTDIANSWGIGKGASYPQNNIDIDSAKVALSILNISKSIDKNIV